MPPRGPCAGEVRLVAVTKSAEIAWIEALLALAFATWAKAARSSCASAATVLVDPSVCWHLIGHLQRNKVRKVLPVAAWIHSVDSLSLLQRLDEIAGELGVRPRVLLEVNVSGEAAKNGFRAGRTGRESVAGRHDGKHLEARRPDDDGPAYDDRPKRLAPSLPACARCATNLSTGSAQSSCRSCRWA